MIKIKDNFKIIKFKENYNIVVWGGKKAINKQIWLFFKLF